MAKNEWITLAEASRRINKNDRYFSALLRRQPDYFKNIHIKKLGTAYVIKENNIEKITARIKKGGVHLNDEAFKRTEKISCTLSFSSPLNIV